MYGTHNCHLQGCQNFHWQWIRLFKHLKCKFKLLISWHWFQQENLWNCHCCFSLLLSEQKDLPWQICAILSCAECMRGSIFWSRCGLRLFGGGWRWVLFEHRLNGLLLKRTDIYRSVWDNNLQKRSLLVDCVCVIFFFFFGFRLIGLMD